MNWFENLRTLKAASNMSMREIAGKSGIPEPTLEKIFSGATKNPGVNTIQSLVHALGFTLNDIDSGSNKNSPSTDESAPGDVLSDIQQKYGTYTRSAFSMYLQLDQDDQGEIRGEMKQMLKADKYKNSPRITAPSAEAV